MAKFRPNLGQFWPKWVIFEFSTKKRNRHFFRLQRLGFVQKIRKFRFSKKMQKTSVFGYFGSKWAKLGPEGAIFEFSVKKWKRHLLTHFFLFFKTKNHKIPMRGFGENLADGERQRDRQRRVTIYRSESARWASDQKHNFRGDYGIISKIRLEHFCCLSKFNLTAKFQKNWMNGLEDISGCTDARTDVIP